MDRFIEKWLAACTFILPLLYLLTEHSWSPIYWHYSVNLLIAIAGYGLFYVVLLASYRWPVPSVFALIRTYTVLVGFWGFTALIGAEALLAVIDDKPHVKSKRLRGYLPDPDVGYVFKPNYEQEVVTLESVTQWHTNSQGRRANRDYGKKSIGLTRILALGDSFTIAVRVPLEDAWPGVLERHLTGQMQSGKLVEVINAGHAAYGTMQQAKWLEKFGDQFDADSVIIAMTPNDIPDNGSEPPGYFTAVGGYLANRNSREEDQLIWEHRQRWYSLPGHVRRSCIWDCFQKVLLWDFGKSALPRLKACQIELCTDERRLHKLTEGFLLEIQDWTRERGIKLGIVLLTFRQQLGEMAPGYAANVFEKRWSRFAKEHGIPVIGTLDAFRAYPNPQSLFWQWDDHYSSEGSWLAGLAALELINKAFMIE